MKKNDWIFVLVILCVSLSGFFVYAKFGQKTPAQVVVKVDGEVKEVYRLSKNREIQINDTNVLVIQDKKVTMTEADCPDQICVKHRPISKNGETIVCLPNKVIVEIVSGDAAKSDAVAN